MYKLIWLLKKHNRLSHYSIKLFRACKIQSVVKEFVNVLILSILSYGLELRR